MRPNGCSVFDFHLNQFLVKYGAIRKRKFLTGELKAKEVKVFLSP
jgi:hypothetical protein